MQVENAQRILRLESEETGQQVAQEGGRYRTDDVTIAGVGATRTAGWANERPVCRSAVMSLL